MNIKWMVPMTHHCTVDKKTLHGFFILLTSLLLQTLEAISFCYSCALDAPLPYFNPFITLHGMFLK
jgi:hypothetical protein